MDDGYRSQYEEYDRAEMAEQRLEIATNALKAMRRQHPATAPAVKLALKQIAEHKQQV